MVNALPPHRYFGQNSETGNFSRNGMVAAVEGDGGVAVGLLVICFIFVFAFAPAVRSIVRRTQWRGWAQRRHASFLGSQTPTGFPVEALENLPLVVACINCVVAEHLGARNIVFDIRKSGFWNRNQRWQTVVAGRVRLSPEEQASLSRYCEVAYESGWTILYPTKRALLQKSVLLRIIDALPPQKFIEIPMVEKMWRVFDESRERQAQH